MLIVCRKERDPYRGVAKEESTTRKTLGWMLRSKEQAPFASVLILLFVHSPLRAAWIATGAGSVARQIMGTP